MNIGWVEVALVAGVAVLVFGPKRIPLLGNALGKTLRGFKEELQPGEKPSDESKRVEESKIIDR